MLWFSLLVGISSSDAKSAYGSGLPYEVDGLTDAIKTHHFDQAGSTLLRTDDAGKVIGRAEYSACGICYFKRGDMATPFLHNGQAGVQTDANGLLNMVHEQGLRDRARGIRPWESPRRTDSYID